MASAGIRKTPTGRYKVWWRLDDASQGSQTFDTRDPARDFKHDLLARLARGAWVDPRLGKQPFETWAREWWEIWSADPDRSPALQATEAGCAATCCPTSASASSARSPSAWCAAGRTSSAARSATTPSWPAGRCCTASSRRPRTTGASTPTPSAKSRPQAASRPGRPARPRQAPVLHPRGVRAPARRHPARLPRPPHLPGRDRAARRGAARPARPPGRPRPRRLRSSRSATRPAGSAAATRTGPRAPPASASCPSRPGRRRHRPPAPRRLPPDELVFAGPGGGNGIPRGTRTPLSRHNLRRAYHAAVAATGEDLPHLDLHGPHDLRHTFATWLEDAGIPSRVIDELMGHSGGHRGGGGDGSPMGRIYRETTPAMLTRVTTVLDDRISRAEQVAKDLPRIAGRPGELQAG